MRIKLGRRRINLRWPLMRRLSHERAMGTQAKALNYERQQLETSLDDERKRLGLLIRELLEIRGRRDLRDPSQYFIQVGFDARLIQHCFMPGDQQIIRLLAERIGRELEKEMLSVNFGRLFSRTDDEWVRIPANRPPYLP